MEIQFVNPSTLISDMKRIGVIIRELITDNGKSLQITIDQAKRMKTVRQLRYYHLLVNLVVKHTGTPKDNLIIQLKNRLGYYKSYYIDGEELKNFLSMKNASIEKANEFVDAVISLCDYLEIKYPDPKEFYKSIGASDE